VAEDFRDPDNREVLCVDDSVTSGSTHAVSADPEKFQCRDSRPRLSGQAQLACWCVEDSSRAPLRWTTGNACPGTSPSPAQRFDQLRAIHFTRSFAGRYQNGHGNIVMAEKDRNPRTTVSKCKIRLVSLRYGGAVLQESGGLPLAPMTIDRELWIGYRIYFLFLIFTSLWTAIRILRIWFRVPPFMGSGHPEFDRIHLDTLERAGFSICRWIGLVLLSWALLGALATARMAVDLERTANTVTVPFVMSDLSASLAAALCTTIFLYLIRWHLLVRIESYRSSTLENKN
jgi:hypothetical protein